MPINISIWGKFPEWDDSFPHDFLWHDTTEKLPELGSILSVFDAIFQVEAIELSAEEEGICYVLDVRPYNGTVLPTLRFGNDVNYKDITAEK